jgi:hypothetical protein
MSHPNHNLQLFQEKKKKKMSNNGGTTEKLRYLENMYRQAVSNQQEVKAAPNTNQFATGGQSRLINALDIEREDAQYNLGDNKLGDYSRVIQGANENLEAVRALNVQTLNSMDDVSRITQTNGEFDGINSQFALDQIERKAFKKYKKTGYNKLSSQYI